jgi:methylated-DNA-[protein]-cysteine S-methyltransferase
MTYKEGTMLYHTIYQSPLGNISLLADDGGLLGAWFLEQKYFERGYEGAERSEQSNVILDSTEMWLDEYFSGKNPEIPDFLAAQGSQFQKNVWGILQEIPQGQTISYGQIADKLNCKSAQAVGGAVGRNPLSIFVPCHRVLGSQGQLSGYAGGLDKKIYLLDHEGVTNYIN